MGQGLAPDGFCNSGRFNKHLRLVRSDTARGMASSLLPWWPKTWNPFSRWHTASHYDYETILSSLADEIKQVESTLFDIKARKRRAIHNVLQVMLTLWIASLVILWVVSSLFWSREWAMSRTILVISLLLGTPLFIAVIHRLVTAWFRRLERAQEQHLDTLRKQQRTKINEIKRATDFDHLRALLDTYDTEAKQATNTASIPSTPASQSNRLLSRRSTTSLRRTTSKDVLRRHRKADSLQEKPKLDEEGVVPSLAPAITGLPILGVQDGQRNPESRPSIKVPDSGAPYPRSWMDKVADMILGTDPYGATLEDQQYALVCRHCFRHNGLVPKNELNEIRTFLTLTYQNIYALTVTHSTHAVLPAGLFPLPLHLLPDQGLRMRQCLTWSALSQKKASLHWNRHKWRIRHTVRGYLRSLWTMAKSTKQCSLTNKVHSPPSPTMHAHP